MPHASVNPQANVFAQDGAPSLPLLHQELVEYEQEYLHALANANDPLSLWWGCLSQISG